MQLDWDRVSEISAGQGPLRSGVIQTLLPHLWPMSRVM